MMKRKGKTNDKNLPESVSDGKAKSSIQKTLPVFDFSKRSHQAAFWMLLNTALYGKKVKSPRINANVRE